MPAMKSSETAAAAPTTAPNDALPADKTGGFDGANAFAHVAALVAIGPRSPNTPGIAKAQQYIRAQLEGFGCKVEEDNFEASTPIGRVPMRNIVAKIPGKSSSILLLSTHYDTSRAIPNFVGANDSGSSSGLMLEMARLLCKRQNALTIWIAFFDGEEAFVEWSDADSVYGSRQMAAQMALSGDLKRLKAMLHTDMIGDRNLNILRDTNSTPWLQNLVFDVAARLGYAKDFSGAPTAIEDDHKPFLKRGISAVDLIDLDYPPWHTSADTLDKVSARSLGVVGHVLIEAISELEKKGW
jgi:Zn-dependent M28 family amino/carboxypeptidase